MFLITDATLPPVDRNTRIPHFPVAQYYCDAWAHCHRQIVFIQGKGSMLIVIIRIQHFKEVTHEKDFKRYPV